MDDTVVDLAHATHASITTGDPSVLEAFISSRKPSARVIAQAYSLSQTRQPWTGDSRIYLALEKRLQVALMEEHVAAQKRMGRTINFLTLVLVLLTIALVWFGIADIKDKRHATEIAARAQIEAAQAIVDGPG